VVTGAGAPRGIGRAIALGLAREGARVAASDVVPELAEEAAAAIREAGGDAVAIRTDVSIATDVAAMVETAVRRFGRLDILVNNAGIALLRPFLDLDESTWDRTFAVNAKGVYLAGQAAARQMVRQGTGGSIINLSSISEEVSGSDSLHVRTGRCTPRSIAPPPTLGPVSTERTRADGLRCLGS